MHRELTWLYRHAEARVVSCVGGMDPRREQRELSEGAHIVVGTPGRLCDHLRRGRLDISELKALVLDEADEMLNLGFREDMEFILETTPDGRRTLLFSATLPRGIVALAREYQHDALRIEVAADEGGHADIDYRAVRIAPGDVEHAVLNLLRYFEAPNALVFCNTREAVRHLQAALLERGFSVVALSGELTQNERTQALQSLRDGRARVCVATDVAARGIDLPNLDLVIHAELPNDPEVMQHRSGRTGRAGRKGVSVLLVPPARRRRAETLLDLAGVEASWGTAPTAEEIRRLDQDRLMRDPLFAEEASADDQALAQMLLAMRSAEEIATALARLYRARLPAPEDILDPGPEGRTGRDRGGLAQDDRGHGKQRRPAADRDDVRPRGPKSARHAMAEGSVWFRAAIGRNRKAEARWLLPMICRRGGIDRHDIGTIRILDTATEFEISACVAAAFAASIRRPDREDSIAIEPLQDGAQRKPRAEDRGADEGRAKPHAKRGGKSSEGAPRAEKGFRTSFDKPSHAKAKTPPRDRPPHAGKSRRDRAPAPKSGFGKKPKKKSRS